MVRTRRGWRLLLALGPGIFEWACGAHAPQPATPPALSAPSSLFEEEIAPIDEVQIDIGELNETPSADGRRVTVSGTLINRGTRATQEVFVHVEALNKDGDVIVSGEARALSAVIAPGSTGAFAVTLDDHPEVDRYHVEAVAR